MGVITANMFVFSGHHCSHDHDIVHIKLHVPVAGIKYVWEPVRNSFMHRQCTLHPA